MDGDGLRDLIIGSQDHSLGDEQFGAVFLVPATRILSLPTEPFISGVEPSQEHFFQDPSTPGIYRLDGKTAKGEFGASIAMVPKLGGDGRDALLVGSPQSDVGGAAKTGGAFIFRLRPDGLGFEPKPIAVLSGETYRVGSNLGASVAATLLDGKPTVVIGSPFGTPFQSADIVDNGTVYTVQLQVDP